MTNKDLLNYRVVGNGSPVLFLHGFLESNSMWEGLTEELSNKQRCIFIELPGHGQSLDFTEEIHTIETMMNAVKRTLQSIAIEQFSIVGHSLGGYVALNLIESNDDFTGKLILLNSHPWEDSPKKKMERDSVIEVVRKNKNLFIQTAIPNLYRRPEAQQKNIRNLIAEASKMSPSSIENVLKAMKNRPDRTKVLRSLKEKCLVIQGEYDHLIDAGNMQKLTNELNCNYALIKSAGHMAHHEAKSEVIEELNRFI